MTQAQARDRVRDLLDQTNTADTQFDQDMVDDLVSQGRRLFARLLPTQMFPSLKTGASLTVTAGIAPFPADFLRFVFGARILVDSVDARFIPEDEMWRIKYLEQNDLVKSGALDKYFYLRTNGVGVLPSDASAVTFEYLKTPGVLSGTDNTDLPKDVEDLSIMYAFEKMMNTQRGDVELGVALARDRGFTVERMQV